MRAIIRLGITAAALLCVGALYWAWQVGPLRDPHDALEDFYSANDRAEDQLMDPLILAGPRVLPLVSAAVADRHMRLRRYAIGFLGIRAYRPASPVLTTIINDSTELDYFRADALEALFQIEPHQAKTLATPLASRNDYLGTRARAVLTGQGVPGFDRTYLQAFRGDHD